METPDDREARDRPGLGDVAGTVQATNARRGRAPHGCVPRPATRECDDDSSHGHRQTLRAISDGSPSLPRSPSPDQATRPREAALTPRPARRGSPSDERYASRTTRAERLADIEGGRSFFSSRKKSAFSNPSLDEEDEELPPGCSFVIVPARDARTKAHANAPLPITRTRRTNEQVHAWSIPADRERTEGADPAAYAELDRPADGAPGNAAVAVASSDAGATRGRRRWAPAGEVAVARCVGDGTEEMGSVSLGEGDDLEITTPPSVTSMAAAARAAAAWCASRGATTAACFSWCARRVAGCARWRCAATRAAAVPAD